MITELTLNNDVTNQRLHISESNWDFVLDGASTTFGVIPSSMGTYKAVNQVGVYISSISLEPREPKLVGWVVGRSRKQLEERKSLLNVLINPLQKLTVECYNNHKISGYPTSSISYSTPWAENNDVICKFMINMYCEDPCFYETSKRETVIAVWDGAFHYPLVIPQSKGIVFGKRNVNLVGTVYNNGDINIGMVIKFKSISTVVNPFIISFATNETIKVTHTMLAEDEIVVDTRFNKKSVWLYREGEEPESIFWALNYPDESVFLQLVVGANRLRYGADENDSGLVVNIEYEPQWLEVQ